MDVDPIALVQATPAERPVIAHWTAEGQAEGRPAHQLFRRYPGTWQVALERPNLPAQRLWRRVIAEFTGGEYTEVDVRPAGWDGPVQIFRSEEKGGNL